MPDKARRLADLRGRRERDAAYRRRRALDPALALAAKIRSSALWRRLRRGKLARDPLCEDCAALGLLEPARQVHHLRPVAERPDLAFESANLRSLCTTCHARREAEERGRP